MEFLLLALCSCHPGAWPPLPLGEDSKGSGLAGLSLGLLGIRHKGETKGPELTEHSTEAGHQGAAGGTWRVPRAVRARAALFYFIT